MEVDGEHAFCWMLLHVSCGHRARHAYPTVYENRKDPILVESEIEHNTA